MLPTKSALSTGAFCARGAEDRDGGGEVRFLAATMVDGAAGRAAGTGGRACCGVAGRLAWVIGVAAIGWDAIGPAATGAGESDARDTGATRAAVTGGDTGGGVAAATAGEVRVTGRERATDGGCVTGPKRTRGAAVRLADPAPGGAGTSTQPQPLIDTARSGTMTQKRPISHSSPFTEASAGPRFGL